MGRKQSQKQIVDASEIPAEVIGAVVSADLAQIIADARTHQDSDAQRRILFAAGRLQQIAGAEVTAELKGKLEAINSILNAGG